MDSRAISVKLEDFCIGLYLRLRTKDLGYFRGFWLL